MSVDELDRRDGRLPGPVARVRGQGQARGGRRGQRCSRRCRRSRSPGSKRRRRPRPTPGGTTPNVGLGDDVDEVGAGRTRSTVTSPARVVGVQRRRRRVGRRPAAGTPAAPSMSSTSDASGDGCGRVDQAQPAADDVDWPAAACRRRTSGPGGGGRRSAARRPRRATIRRGPGGAARSPSNVVSVSNSWAVTAALPASPWAAGSSVGRARRRGSRAGPVGRRRPRRTRTPASERRAGRPGRRIGGSIGRVPADGLGPGSRIRA